MEWGSDTIDQLRALWAEGHSTAEIGRRMGVTKNAVVGKAHRLNLPPRPSPIRREAEPPRLATPRRAPAPRPPMLLRRQEPPAGMPAGMAASSLVPPRPQPARAAPPPPAPAVVRAFPRLSNRSCCWPIGEPGTSGFRFCAAEANTGKPYCGEHAAVAYVKSRDRREDAA